ncbi:tyrosine-type recombinase/integrase [Burkholderia glumae]
MPSIIKRSSRGTTKYEAQIRKKGGVSISRTFPSRREAQVWAATIESEIVRGVFVDRTSAERTTLADLLERYGREISPYKKGGDLEILRIQCLISDPLARIRIAALTGTHIAQYRDRRLAGDIKRKPVSGSTVNRELTIISHVLTIASKEWGVHVHTNPVSQIRRPRENRARTRRLRRDEEERLLAELGPNPDDVARGYGAGGCRGCRNEYMRPIVVFAVETAMRRSEILSLHWSDVFLEERYVRLHDTKSGDARDVPLSSRAIQTLTELPTKDRCIDGRVFPVSAEALKQSFVRACERAGIRDLRFHDLRHEATSRISERLDNVLELSAVTGHKTVQMLKRYYHPRATDLARKLG